ncbi:hypothetical protein GF325_07075 [Candidatus Bathyarchaeota archaeon]|nr:hypothetical protein [Candidatus Bathyarchaeota archaeon]
MNQEDTTLQNTWIHQAKPWSLIIAAGFMLASCVLTLVAFTLGSGRFVPTGSILGFQGPSYFYLTGLPAGVIAFMLLGKVLGSIKSISVKATRDSVHVSERKIFKKTRYTILKDELRLVSFKHLPGPRSVAWFIMSSLLLLVSLEFLAANPVFQGVAGNVTAFLVLVLHGILIAIAITVPLLHPGLKIMIFTSSGKFLLRLPGICQGKRVQSRFLNMMEKAADLSLQPSTGELHMAKGDINRAIGFNAGFFCLGVIGMVGILLNSNAIVVNVASAWIMVMVGIVGLLTIPRMDQSLLKHVHEVNGSTGRPLPGRRFVHPACAWLFAVSMSLFSYVLGKSMKGWFLSSGGEIWRVMLHAIITIVFITFTCWQFTLRYPSISFEINDSTSIIMMPFHSSVITQSRQRVLHSLHSIDASKRIAFLLAPVFLFLVLGIFF